MMKKKQEMLFTLMKAKPGQEVGFYFGRLEPFVKFVEAREEKRVTKTGKMKKGSKP